MLAFLTDVIVEHVINLLGATQFFTRLAFLRCVNTEHICGHKPQIRLNLFVCEVISWRVGKTEI